MAVPIEVKREGAALAGGRVACLVVAVSRVRHLVVRVEGVRRSLKAGWVAGAARRAPVIAEGVGVAAASGAGFPGDLAAVELRVGRLGVVVGIARRAAVSCRGVAHGGRHGQSVARTIVAAGGGNGEVGEGRPAARLVRQVPQAALLVARVGRHDPVAQRLGVQPAVVLVGPACRLAVVVAQARQPPHAVIDEADG